MRHKCRHEAYVLSVNFARFLRTTFFIEHLWWLILSLEVFLTKKKMNNQITSFVESNLAEHQYLTILNLQCKHAAIIKMYSISCSFFTYRSNVPKETCLFFKFLCCFVQYFVQKGHLTLNQIKKGSFI